MHCKEHYVGWQNRIRQKLRDLEVNAIEAYPAALYTPQENKRAERMNCTKNKGIQKWQVASGGLPRLWTLYIYNVLEVMKSRGPSRVHEDSWRPIT